MMKKALSNVSIGCVQPGICSLLVKVQSIAIMVCNKILPRTVKSLKGCFKHLTLFHFFFPVIPGLAFLLILTLFTEDAALHSKSALLPEPTHSCPSFLPTLVPVQLHNCPLHFFPRLLFSWITSLFWLISKYEPVANSILNWITRQVGTGKKTTLLFCFRYLASESGWPPLDFGLLKLSAMQARLTCYPCATCDVHRQYILLADFIWWLSFLRATSEWVAG